MTSWLLPFWKALQSPAVYKEDIEPPIVVIVIESHATACSLKQVFVFLDTAEDGLRIQSGSSRDIDTTDAKRIGGFLAFSNFGISAGGLAPQYARAADLIEAQNKTSAAERSQEISMVELKCKP